MLPQKTPQTHQNYAVLVGLGNILRYFKKANVFQGSTLKYIWAHKNPDLVRESGFLVTIS